MPSGEGSGPKGLPTGETPKETRADVLSAEDERRAIGKMNDRIESHYSRGRGELGRLINESDDPETIEALKKVRQELDRVRGHALFTLSCALGVPEAKRQLPAVFDPTTFKKEEWLEHFLEDAGIPNLEKLDNDADE